MTRDEARSFDFDVVEFCRRVRARAIAFVQFVLLDYSFPGVVLKLSSTFASSASCQSSPEASVSVAPPPRVDRGVPVVLSDADADADSSDASDASDASR